MLGAGDPAAGGEPAALVGGVRRPGRGRAGRHRRRQACGVRAGLRGLPQPERSRRRHEPGHPGRDAAVLQAASGNAGGAAQGGFASFAGSGNVVLPPPPASAGGDFEAGGGLSGAIESINHYSNVLNTTDQTFEDNDVTNIDDADTTVDASVNQNITAFGGVNQDFGDDVVSGDGAQVNTGDGAVRAGGDIDDSNVVTGDVSGSAPADDISDSVVGDGNQVISYSSVGAASLGEGDATNVEAENAVLGDGTLVDGGEGDITFNQGEGDVAQIDDSTLSESVVGDGTVQSNDVAIDADDGSSVAFGDGSTSTAETQDIDVDDNDGTVPVADDGTRRGRPTARSTTAATSTRTRSTTASTTPSRGR